MPGGNNKDLHLRHILYAMHFSMPRCEAFRRERAKRKPRVLLLTRGFRLVFSSFSLLSLFQPNSRRSFSIIFFSVRETFTCVTPSSSATCVCG